MPARKPDRCAWCGREIVQSGSGRHRRYCSQSCRQRAYEQRRQLSGTGLPADVVVLSRRAAEELTDTLFELRCAAEDVRTAVTEDADAVSSAEVAALCTELVTMAKTAEKIRRRVGEDGAGEG
jgi:hypothetical protein